MTASGQRIPDSLFVKDNPVVAQLDSLANLKFFTNSVFTTDVAKLNKYGFPADSVPVYADSVYAWRIRNMNVDSPFEYVYNEQVRSFIDLYAAKKRRLTSRMLGLAELYFPMFEEHLDKHDLPLEFKYLAIIESALNPIARSRAGAAGLWQFMLGTGKLYDLKVSSYVDDRCDPYKATIAACRHLKDLYDIYGDWFIVLAAYNAGPGSVNRAIRNSGLDTNDVITYWKIQSFLPRETQNYVPAFIGVSYVMEYAAEHNLYPLQPPFLNCDIDTVVIRDDMTFQQISSFLCIPLETVQFLNPAYRKGIIPATKENPYVVRLPREYMDEFINNQLAISNYKSTQEIEYQAQLAKMATTKTTPAVQAVKPAPGTSGTPVKQATNAQTNYSKYVYHTVQKGDSLWSIASKYKGTSVDEIRRLNNLSVKQTIYPGQKLKIGLKG